MRNTNKKLKRTIAIISAVAILLATTPAFAATNYVNSVGSDKQDIAVLESPGYSVKGNDISQNKKSEYSKITFANENIVSKCDVYATIAEGSDVYDPSNPNANENGFVDGKIVVAVPTTLIMNGTPTNDGKYIAKGVGKVKGNIAGTTVINVVPDSSFNMSQKMKNDITATVEQDFTKFVVPTSTVKDSQLNNNVTPDFNDKSTFVVTVTTDKATAGSWNGSFNYNIFSSTAV